MTKESLAAEVLRVRSALDRYIAELDRLDRAWPRGECCPCCWYGRPYVKLVRKVERVTEWLAVLEAKAIR